MEITPITSNSNPILPNNHLSDIDLYNRLKNDIKNEIEGCIPAVVQSVSGKFVTVQPLPNLKTNNGSFIQRKPVTVRMFGSASVGTVGYLISCDVPSISNSGVTFESNTYNPSDGESHRFTNGFFLSPNISDKRGVMFFSYSYNDETGKSEALLSGGHFVVMRKYSSSETFPYPSTHACSYRFVRDLYKDAHDMLHSQGYDFRDKYGDSVYISAVLEFSNWYQHDDAEGYYTDYPNLRLLGFPDYRFAFDPHINGLNRYQDITFGDGFKYSMKPYTQYYPIMELLYNPNTGDASVLYDMSCEAPLCLPYMPERT